MDIYLTHPVHGTKVACMELEAVADEKNGWTRYDPRQLELTLPEPEPLAATTENAMAFGARPRRQVNCT
jgi:hypothetical protein